MKNSNGRTLFRLTKTGQGFSFELECVSQMYALEGILLLLNVHDMQLEKYEGFDLL